MSAEARAGSPGTIRRWVMAARPATLTAAAAPVLVGTAAAWAVGAFHAGPALAALAGALLLQVAANLANDVFDFEKGADTEHRLGPTRVVQSGLLSARAVRRGLAVVLALALAVGVYLVWVGGPVIVAIGILSILAAIAYTGGPYPLGYNGLGDIAVFLFFGFVAVCGTTFVQAGHVPAISWWAAVPVGALTTAILVVNNIRDIETDAVAGKRTLAVRFGRRAILGEYAGLFLVAYGVPVVLAATGRLAWPVLLPLLSAPVAVRWFRHVRRETGRALNPARGGTARLLFLFALLFAAGIALGASADPAAFRP